MPSKSEKEKIVATLCENHVLSLLETDPNKCEPASMEKMAMSHKRAHANSPPKHSEKMSLPATETRSPKNLLQTEHSLSLPLKHTRSNGKRRRQEEVVIEDNADGELKYHTGDIIQKRYKVLNKLGEGCYGAVVTVQDLEAECCMALKIAYNRADIRTSAQQELQVLKEIARKDPASKNFCVKMLGDFDYNGHICLLFEKLGSNLYDFMRKNKYNPYPLDQVRHIAYQLCRAVKFLHDNRITHTDLKTENIVFVDSAYKLYYDDATKSKVRRVKNADIRLIDFGLATFEHQEHSKVVSACMFRAPEVILELGWSHPCDVCSIGCILFELYVGRPLFTTENQREHLALMEAILGPLPQRMVRETKTSYFDEDGCENMTLETKQLNAYQKGDSEEDRELFDLIKKMLEFEPDKRIQLGEALQHPFIMKLPAEQPISES